MKERWLPVGLIAGGLFLVNVVARLVVRFGAGSDDDKQITIGLWALFAVGAVMIPIAFWFFSMGGGLMTLVYGIAKREPVIIIGQAAATIIYIRNIMLIVKNRGQASKTLDR